MATIDPTLREVLRSRLGREPTHKEMCDAATNAAESELDPALIRAAVDAYDAERIRQYDKWWFGGKCEPMSDANKEYIAPMIAAAVKVAVLAERQACVTAIRKMCCSGWDSGGDFVYVKKAVAAILARG